MAKIGRNEQCPCGSGKKYKHCCYHKAYDYVRQDDEVYRVQPVDERYQKLQEQISDEYLKHLDRLPTRQDPISIWQFMCGMDEMVEQKCNLLAEAGTDPALIWAYKKTGFLIVEGDDDYYSEDELEEWDNAVQEFYDHDGDPGRTPISDRYDEVLTNLQEEMTSLMFLMGLANYRFFNNESINHGTTSKELLTHTQYQAYCVARSHRSLRAIITLVGEKHGDAALKICRSIYENYLHMVYVRQQPDMVRHLVDAKYGLQAGTHEYKKRSKGRVDKRTIVEKESGDEFRGHISAFEMASQSPYPEDIEFFEFFYSFTSADIHPDVNKISQYLSRSGLQPLKRELHDESIIFTTLVASMVADQIRHMNKCPDDIKRDIVAVTSRIRALVIEALVSVATWSTFSGISFNEFDPVMKRSSILPDGSSV